MSTKKSSNICLYCGMQYACDLPSDISCGFFTPHDDDSLNEYNRILREHNKPPIEKVIKNLKRNLGI